MENREPIIISGRYANAHIYASVLDETSIEQIKILTDAPFVENESVRIMPDAHAGKGCVIGYTQTIKSGKVCPSLVGVDISCGMLTVELGKVEIDYERFDRTLHEKIPTGMKVHEGRLCRFSRLQDLNCYRMLNDVKRLERSIGTLGGGNHFIELDKDSDGVIYLVVHTGSRNLGKQIAEYYQNLADELVNHNMKTYFDARDELIERYKAEGRRSEIQSALKDLERSYKREDLDIVPKDLAWLEGEYFDRYLEDTRIAGEYAALNRRTIADLIIKGYFGSSFSLDDYLHFETVHNYIDLEDKIIRKGAIRAHEGDIVLIPISMKDGSLICRAKGNAEYNFSAPHGAGRKLSRNKAFSSLGMEEFKKEMDGIYSSCVVPSTLDESPMAYKALSDILPMLEGTCDVIKHIRPVLSFKATGVRSDD